MILVAGGTGRLGSLVVRDLLDRGHRVRVLTRDRLHADELSSAGAEVAVGDVRNADAVNAAVTGADTVVSAVHGFIGPRGESPATVDRDGNANLVAAAETEGADVVLMSVTGARPDSPMELFRMKYAAEQRLARSDTPGTVVRAAAFAELWIEILRETARRGRPLVFGRGDNPISFVSVQDVAGVVIRAVEDRGSRDQVLEIAGPEAVTFNQLAGLVQRADGGTGSPRHVPRAVLRLLAGPASIVRPSMGRQLRAALAMDQEALSCDSSSARTRFPDLPCTTVAEVLASKASG